MTPDPKLRTIAELASAGPHDEPLVWLARLLSLHVVWMNLSEKRKELMTGDPDVDREALRAVCERAVDRFAKATNMPDRAYAGLALEAALVLAMEIHDELVNELNTRQENQ